MSNNIRQRWGLPEEAFEERFQKAIYRIIAYTGDRIDVSRDELRYFAFIAKVPIDTYQYISGAYYSDLCFNAKKYFLEAKQPYELAEKLENLLKSNILTNDQKEGVVTIVSNENIGIRVSKNKKGNYITYPQGEPVLDEKVVERTLLCLDGESAKEYTKSLKAYASGKWNESSNNARRALEEYLRQYLNNTAGLKANITKVGAALKDGNIAEHFRNSIVSQLRTLDAQYNSGSKHNSNTQGSIEVEYLIYSVGIMINTLEQIRENCQS